MYKLYKAKDNKDENNKSTSHPHPVDIHVGKQIKVRRKILGMSQSTLGKAIGLTFQQVQKYERGTNRIGASRLYDLSKVLEIPVNYFFDGFEKYSASSDSAGLSYVGEKKADSYEIDWLSSKELLELVKAFNKINDQHLRKQILDLAKSIAKQFDEK